VDRISKEKRSRVMSAIRSTDTQPELRLRRALWAKGMRYRIHYGSEKIDIAFPSKKIAVFVDGCFWHGCPLHSHFPKSNVEYWHPKLRRNIERDKAKESRLRSGGWKVLRLWEHELADISPAVDRVIAELSSQGSI
jgi:DNA mismatch endonuclease (patch repair protein)